MAASGKCKCAHLASPHLAKYNFAVETFSNQLSRSGRT